MCQFTPTKASAACSRGLTRSHNDIPPFHLPPPLTPIHSRPSPSSITTPTRPARTPIPSPSPLLRNPTPIRTPIHFPIRSPFSIPGPSPCTPSTPPMDHFVSPTLLALGAREKKREVRQESPLSHFAAIAKAGARDMRRDSRLEATPKPPRRSDCPECDRAKMLLPAKWCGHQVTPSRMKNGLRVVRLFPPKPRTANKTEQKPRRSRRTGQAEAKPVATVPLVTEPTPKQTIASPLATHILSTPTQSDHLRSTHTHSTNTRSSFALPDPFGPPHTPFKNPHLKDQPLHWSPRMFKPQMDRHNWTWSDWDSPSQEIEDVTYESEDLPRHDPFKHCPPELQAKLRAILNMKPSLSPTSTLSTDSDTADTVRYEYVDIVSSFSSSSSGDSTRSRSSDSFSSWVELNDIPWDDTLLERWLLLQKFQARRARGYEYTKLNLPPLSAPGKDASVHSQPADEPTDQPADQSANQSANQSAELSSLLRLYTDRDSNDGTDHAIGDNCSDDSSTDIEDIMNRLRPNLRSDSPTGPSANHPADAAAEIQDIMKSLMPNPDPDSSSSSDSSSDSSTGSTGEIQEIMRRLRPNPKKPGPGSSDNSSADIQDVVGQLMARPGSDSTDFIHPTSDTPSAARQHFHSLQQSSLSTACRQLHSLPAPQHLYAARQLPSATVAEPQQSQGSGFGWKSLACVAVAAATVGAGLAYAWLSV